ncbi:tRNA preQ1(34) S-adenosylmethionine ribosyltransferase-isomerase QueA [Armatimonas sp.]|uniref:tRNA preQ1(34) S-adenosylmethionine ribosyltransferase-isomerase QueA n=1 Tax=Armatimonas sp. TaxID=1872638 RepID=UPI003751C60B
MRLSDFDYNLPEERIAQIPLEPRDSSRLLCVDRASGVREHRIFRELPELLRSGDLLVLNETRVSALRLFGERPGTGGQIEVFILRPAIEHGDSVFEALVRPGKKLLPGQRVQFPEVDLEAEALATLDNGGRLLRFLGEDVLEKLVAIGRVPLPPYITAPLTNKERYQTVYAKTPGSAAAPTAGLHFTPELLEKLQAQGVEIARLRLDVGIGTFRPIKTENIAEHVMHTETYAVSEATAMAVNQCSGRVIAVGTTALRALESAGRLADGQGSGERVVAVEGETGIFITPGYAFGAVDGLITNFHQPRSSLLLLVAAFMGYASMRSAYEEALGKGYRFLSFGDAMLAV